jgi:single-strand DNA-binding protein
MSSVNKAIIVGNLGRDPDVKRTPDGTAVANLSVATSESWTDKNSGDRRERTEWHRVVVWNKLAEIAEKYLKKGSKVYLEGKIATRKWTDQQGVEKYSTEIVLQGFDAKLVMLDGRQESGGRSESDDAGSGGGGAGGDLDDEIPF